MKGFSCPEAGDHYRSRLRTARRVDFIEFKRLTYFINVLAHTGTLMGRSPIVESLLAYLSIPEKKRIVSDTLDYMEKVRIDPEEVDTIRRRMKFDSVEEVIDRLTNTVHARKRVFRAIFEPLVAIRDRAASRICDGKVKKNLDAVAGIFSLNPVEKEILLLFHLINTDNIVDGLHDSVNDFAGVRTHTGISQRNKWPIAILTGCKRADIDKAFCQSGTLFRTGLIGDEIDVSSEIMSFLEGSNDKPISSRYFADFTGDAVPLECHAVERRHIDMIRTLLENKSPERGTNILLYGEPGTGKTEFARSLGRAMGLPIYEINNVGAGMEKEQQINFFRYRALAACQRMVDANRSVIVVDEADTMLNSTQHLFSFGPVAEKGQTNKVLDDSRGFVFWITNRFDGIDESTRRRFDYSVGFEKLTFTKRKSIWKHSLAKHGLTGLIDERRIESLASDYEISAGGIDVALRNAARLPAPSRTQERLMETIRGLLRAHLRMIGQDRCGRDERKANAPEYTIDGLSIAGDIQGVLGVVDRFNDYWSREEPGEVRNMNLLLYGPPGTGKTEFAKYAARRMNRRLIVKRASDLMNCYVGETEKSIRRAFTEAESDKAVLFIDEADSFLGSRESAVRSWEVTQVNELLTNMENFRGMLICATNFKKIVDSAAIRRFNIKLEFDYLEYDGVEVFYELFLRKLVSVSRTPEETARLRVLAGLTPGDFKVVYQRFSFFDRNRLTHAMLIDALQGELKAKDDRYGRSMGFTAA